MMADIPMVRPFTIDVIYAQFDEERGQFKVYIWVWAEWNGETAIVKRGFSAVCEG